MAAALNKRLHSSDSLWVLASIHNVVTFRRSNNGRTKFNSFLKTLQTSEKKYLSNESFS